MKSTFVIISILLKSNLSERCLVNPLTSINNESLRDYVRLANVYDGNSNQRKSDFTEMIVYGYMNGKLSKKPLENISTSTAIYILKEKRIPIKSLPGYGNSKLKKKDIINKHESECSIKLND